MSEIMNFWVLDQPPRKTQVQVLDWLQRQTKKYLVIQMPVGSGKSVIGMTYSRFMSNHVGNCFILTPQKILQHQYEQSFKNDRLVSLYGKSNYTCKNQHSTCEVGQRMSKGQCPNCPWMKKRTEAIAAPNVVLNYKLALLYFANADFFRKRKLIVCDEAHTLEQHLVDFDCPIIKRELAISLKVEWIKPKDMSHAQDWLLDQFIPALMSRINLLSPEIEAIIESGSLSKREAQQVQDYDRLVELFNELSTLAALTTDVLNASRVLVHNDLEISFKRIKGDHAFNHILNGFADRFLFMSSTIIDPVKFCEDLGIDPNQMAFLDIDSEFEIENRPVFYTPMMKVNASWNDPERREERDELIDGINSILQLHKNESGIIHTGNFKLAEFLVKNIDSDHHIIDHNSSSDMDRDTAIKQYLHQASHTPTILISPSCTEGLDLVDDLGRFAIFAKVPYGNLTDQWIKRRMELSSEWYKRQALVSIIQGGGRVVRSPTDHGSVYIMDANWSTLYSAVQRSVPQWWKDAYQCI